MGWLSTPRRRWYLLAALWFGLLVVGIGGFVQQSAEGGLGRTSLDNLYLTLQLATLDYGAGTEAMNWRLQVARFVAPVMAASTVLQTATVVFRSQYERWRLRYLRGHTVVCGLGEAGTRLALALADAGHAVVGVDRDPAAAGLGTLRERDVATLVADPADPDVLRSLRVDRAERVVAIGHDDAANVGVTVAARQVERDGRRPALRAAVHLDDADLTALLRGVEVGGASAVRVEFFNLHERAARALLAEHPVLAAGPSAAASDSAPHLVVVGLGRLGRSVVVAAAQAWARDGDGPLPVTLVDREATGRWHALRLQHPGLADAAHVRCLDLDLDAPTGEAVDTFTTLLRDDPPSLVAVVFDNEAMALSSALFVHRAVRGLGTRVVMRTDTDGGLSDIVRPTGDDAPFPGLALFAFLDRTCTPALVEGGVREQLAHALHDDHVARSSGASVAALHRPWDDLADADRESSRRAADGIVDGLAARGFDLVPLRHWGDEAQPLSEEDVDALAAEEHGRWKAEREADGWTHGPTRDDAAKRNPLLVAWSEVPQADRTWTLETVRGMPATLARAGFELSSRRI